MGFRTIETGTTKDRAVADAVYRWETMQAAQGRLYSVMASQTANPNVVYASVIIMDDRGAVYKNEEYIAPVEEPGE